MHSNNYILHKVKACDCKKMDRYLSAQMYLASAIHRRVIVLG